MTEWMYADPVGFYSFGYFLMVVLLWMHYCKVTDLKLHRLPQEQMIAIVLWPITLALSIILLIVLGTLTLWEKLTGSRKRDKLES